MQLVYEHTTASVLWRMHLCSNQALVCLELRDATTLQVQFEILDLTQQRSLGILCPIPHIWWVGVAAFNNLALLLHGYDPLIISQQRGLFAYSIPTLLQVWSHPKALFQSIAERCINVRLNPEADITTIDIQTGLPCKADSGVDLAQPTSFHIPFGFEPSDLKHPILTQYLEQITTHKPTGLISYLEYQNLQFIGYQVEAGTHYDYYLLISNSEGNVLLHKQTDTGAVGMASGLFATFANCLITIENSRTLCCYEF